MRRLFSAVVIVMLAASVPGAIGARDRGSLGAADQAGAAADPRVDAIFAQWDRSDSPGCALGVVRDGTLVYRRGYGMANLDYGIPNSPRMVYYVGSVSKQFTAAAIALLAAEGRLSLDDPVRKHIPELPDYGQPLTIRHLVHHTSGIRDIYALMDLAGIRMEDVFPDEEMLALITAQKRLNFVPGSEYLYSNSGYWLLGQIVERVTGESLREYARQKIFEPLGMADTHFHDDPGHVMRNRVVSYMPAGGRGGAPGTFRVADLPNFDKIGAGGLYTTVEDLAKWDRNFYQPRVGGPAFLQQMLTRGVLANGESQSYAFGLTIGSHRGLPTVRHGGSLMGFRAELLRFPGQRFSVILLCNLGSIAPAGLADRVAAVYLGDRMSPPAAEAQGRGAGRGNLALSAGASGAVAVDPTLVGSYRSDEVRATYTIETRDGRLVLKRPPGLAPLLMPVARDEYRAGNLTLRFVRDASGRAVAFTVQAGRVRDIRFEREPTPPPPHPLEEPVEARAGRHGLAQASTSVSP